MLWSAPTTPPETEGFERSTLPMALRLVRGPVVGGVGGGDHANVQAEVIRGAYVAPPDHDGEPDRRFARRLCRRRAVMALPGSTVSAGLGA